MKQATDLLDNQDLPHRVESRPTEDARVILRDGNLVTLRPSVLKEEAVKNN
jgi:hypothetical protein